jgi:hypothetical protein
MLRFAALSGSEMKMQVNDLKEPCILIAIKMVYVYISV